MQTINQSETVLEIDENKETHNIGKGGANLFSNLIGDKSIPEPPFKESRLTDSLILEEKENLPSFTYRIIKKDKQLRYFRTTGRIVTNKITVIVQFEALRTTGGMRIFNPYTNLYLLLPF